MLYLPGIFIVTLLCLCGVIRVVDCNLLPISPIETEVKYEDDLHERFRRIDRFLKNQQSLKLIRSLVRQKICRLTIP